MRKRRVARLGEYAQPGERRAGRVGRARGEPERGPPPRRPGSPPRSGRPRAPSPPHAAPTARSRRRAPRGSPRAPRTRGSDRQPGALRRAPREAPKGPQRRTSWRAPVNSATDDRLSYGSSREEGGPGGSPAAGRPRRTGCRGSERGRAADRRPAFAPSAYPELRWRMIGPFRGGRTRAAVGVPGQPNVFYVGLVNGGVWKTDDSGRTWTPIFDDQPTQSIGDIAIAPSDPNVVYVASGEGLQRPDLAVGDGIYQSADAGRTWTHLGLRDGQAIPAIRRRSARSESALRGRARTPLRPQPRARHLPLHRRRADLDRRCSTRTRTRAAATSRSIPPIPTSSTPACGSRASAPGRTTTSTAAPEAASTSPRTAATPGVRSRRACPPTSCRSTWRSRRADRAVSSRPCDHRAQRVRTAKGTGALSVRRRGRELARGSRPTRARP